MVDVDGDVKECTRQQITLAYAPFDLEWVAEYSVYCNYGVGVPIQFLYCFYEG